MKEVGEIGDGNGGVVTGGGAAGGVGNEDEETSAMRCLDGGGTLSMLGIVVDAAELVLIAGRLWRQAVLCCSQVWSAFVSSSGSTETHVSHILQSTRSESNLRT